MINGFDLRGFSLEGLSQFVGLGTLGGSGRFSSSGGGGGSSSSSSSSRRVRVIIWCWSLDLRTISFLPLPPVNPKPSACGRRAWALHTLQRCPSAAESVEQEASTSQETSVSSRFQLSVLWRL